MRREGLSVSRMSGALEKVGWRQSVAACLWVVSAACVTSPRRGAGKEAAETPCREWLRDMRSGLEAQVSGDMPMACLALVRRKPCRRAISAAMRSRYAFQRSQRRPLEVAACTSAYCDDLRGETPALCERGALVEQDSWADFLAAALRADWPNLDEEASVSLAALFRLDFIEPPMPSPGNTDPEVVIVVQWDGQRWEAHGQEGSIQSEPVSAQVLTDTMEDLLRVVLAEVRSRCEQTVRASCPIQLSVPIDLVPGAVGTLRDRLHDEGYQVRAFSVYGPY